MQGPFLIRIAIIGFVLLMIALAFSSYLYNEEAAPPINACTADAKLCPDGSGVGRSGPQCEFAACPGEGMFSDATWQTATDATTHLNFSYPKNATTQYTHFVDWPPQVTLLTESYACTEEGAEVLPAGRTFEKEINGHVYCISEESEGAAGSTYTQYVYTSEKDGLVAAFGFTVRSVQCLNYDEPQASACQKEQASFDIDNLIDHMFQTLKSTPV